MMFQVDLANLWLANGRCTFLDRQRPIDELQNCGIHDRQILWNPNCTCEAQNCENIWSHSGKRVGTFSWPLWRRLRASNLGVALAILSP